MAKKVLYMALICIVFGSLWRVPDSEGFLYKNEEKEIYVKGKLVSDVIFRTEDTVDTNPVPIEAWDTVQQRNTLMLEVTHNVGRFFNDVEVAYHLAPRLFYDSNWDIGPGIFSEDDTRRKYGFNNRDEIDDEKFDAEFYLGYADFRKGPLFFRVGKQAFQWGEMSTIRVLDACLPQDNQSLAVDLEEKLIPLSLIRGTYSLYDVGPLESLLFEGYWIPNAIDDNYKENVVAGGPRIPPIGRKGPYDPTAPVTPQRFHDPEEDRYGFRVGAKMGELDVYLAHFRKYTDSDVVVGNMDLTSPTFFRIDKYVTPIDVTGASFSYYSNALDGVIRGEAALFQDEPFVKDNPNIPGSHQFHYEKATYTDVLRYGLAFDKYKMIPFLNPSYEFFFSLEWVGSKIMDYDSNFVYPWLDPETGKKLYMDEYQNTFLLVASTVYGGGRLDANLSLIYDANSRTLMYIPKAKLMVNRNLFAELSYKGTISDNYDGYGFQQDRDELTFKISYYF